MEYLLQPWSWIVLGGVLILLEFFIPGLVVIFLGLGALATAGMLHAHFINDGYLAIVFFVLSSVFLLATLRRIVTRFYPSFSEKAETDEDALLVGQMAEAMTDIAPNHFEGRVRYSGTTWSAKSAGGVIPAGAQVEIIGRENINLIVRRK